MGFQQERRPAFATGGGPDDFLRGSRDHHNSERNPRRQRLARQLHDAGPRPVLEALIEVAAGVELDLVLNRYARIPVEIYHALGANRLAVDEVELIDGGRL